MWQVTLQHHKKAWRNGDLEDALELEWQENFKTREAAKEFMERKLRNMSGEKLFIKWHKGDEPSYAVCWTGMTWKHENTGELQREYYHFLLKKVKLR